MAIIISSPDPRVTNTTKLEVLLPQIKKAYWQNSKDSKIKHIVPGTKYILTLEIEGARKNSKIEVTVKNTEAYTSGLPLMQDTVLQAKVADDLQTATAEFTWEWKYGGSFSAMIQGRDIFEAESIYRPLGIWIKGGAQPYLLDINKSEMEVLGEHSFVREVYQAYHFLKNVDTIFIIEDFYKKKENPNADLFVKKRKAIYEYKNYDRDKQEIQNMGDVCWLPRVARNFGKLSQSPALLLFHEFGHAYDALKYSLSGLMDMYNNRSPHIKILTDQERKAYGNQAEFHVITEYEYVAARDLKQAQRTGHGGGTAFDIADTDHVGSVVDRSK